MLGAALLVLAAGGEPAWREVAAGLEVAEMVSPVPSEVGDSTVAAVRVDPARYAFRLMSSKKLGLERNPTAREWVEGHGLLGAINASMYQGDHRTSVAYMRAGDAVLSPRWTRDNAVFAAGPRDPTLPPAQIIDRTCQDLDSLKGRYAILVQSIRMLDCAGRNTWARQDRKWSTAAIGADREGRILLLHCRSPYATHDFVEILRRLPLGLLRLMYVEGGPEASLFVKVDGRVVVSRVGSFETGFRPDDTNDVFWPIPNVIGFARR